jgi:hypothetical protein
MDIHFIYVIVKGGDLAKCVFKSQFLLWPDDGTLTRNLYSNYVLQANF